MGPYIWAPIQICLHSSWSQGPSYCPCPGRSLPGRRQRSGAHIGSWRQCINHLRVAQALREVRSLQVCRFSFPLHTARTVWENPLDCSVLHDGRFLSIPSATAPPSLAAERLWVVRWSVLHTNSLALNGKVVVEVAPLLTPYDAYMFLVTVSEEANVAFLLLHVASVASNVSALRRLLW